MGVDYMSTNCLWAYHSLGIISDISRICHNYELFRGQEMAGGLYTGVQQVLNEVMKAFVQTGGQSFSC